MKRKPTIDDIFEDKNGLKWIVVAINPRHYTIDCLDSQEFLQIELRVYELVRDYKFILNAFIVGDGTVIIVDGDGEAVKTNICIDY